MRQRAATSGAAAPAAAAAAAAASSGPDAATAAGAMSEGDGSPTAMQELVAARGLDVDAGLVAAEAAGALQYLAQQGQLPPDVTHGGQLVARALALTDLLATGSTFRSLQMLKRHPALLSLPPDLVAHRVLQLKLLMPAANVAQLLYQRPTLLLIQDLPGVVGSALAKLHALMPGIPVEAKLHEGGTVFWSFVSLLQDTASANASSRGAAPSSAAGTAPPPVAGAAGTHDAPASAALASSGGASPASPDARLSQQQL